MNSCNDNILSLLKISNKTANDQMPPYVSQTPFKQSEYISKYLAPEERDW